MSMRCKVCDHAERSAIELAMSTASNRSIALRWSLTKDTVTRHRANHLGPNLLRLAETREALGAESILDQLTSLQARTLAALSEAEGDKKTRPSERAKLIKECRENMMAAARLTGMLKDGATIDNRTQIAVSVFGEITTDELRKLASLAPKEPPKALN